MSNNNDMRREFANAAEAAEFERYRQEAEQAQQQLAESEGSGPAEDPVTALQGQMPEEKRGKFVRWLDRNARIGATAVGAVIDDNADAINTLGDAVPMNPAQGGRTAGMLGGATSATATMGSDVAQAAMNPANTAKQVPSGVLNAWNEINSFGNSLDIMTADALGYWPQAQIFDEAGNLDPKILNLAEEAVQQRLRADGPLQVENTIEAPVTGTGALVQGISQFMAPFGAYNKALKSAGVLAQPGYWQALPRAALAGFAADFSAFDPEDGRLTDMLEEFGLDGLAIEYLKSDPDDTEMEGRFKTAIEGLGLGVLGEVVVSAFRSGRSMRQVKEGLDQRIMAMERLDAEAATRIDEDIFSLGNPDDPMLQTFEPPRAQTAAQREAGALQSSAQYQRDLDTIRQEGGPGLNERIREAVQRRDAAMDREPVTNAQRFYETDYFDMPRRADGDGGKFAFGEKVPNRERFIAEETAGRMIDGGEMVGFRARAGDIGVTFTRNRTASNVSIEWDWLDNTAAGPGAQFRAKKTSIADANEIVSKVMAVVEADAKASRPPSYSFVGANEALDKVYTRLLPKIAQRMGYKAEMTEFGFRLVREEFSDAFGALREMNEEMPANSADRLARARKRQDVIARMNEETGYRAEVGSERDSVAARALQQELSARFSVNTGTGRTARTGADRVEHLKTLRDEAEYWFGDAYKKLETTGRIQYAAKASDVDPNWVDRDDFAQGVTMPGGQVFIFTETVRPRDMRGLILHEAAVHSGMENMLGKKTFNEILKSLKKTVDRGEVTEVERAYIRAVNAAEEGMTERQLLEEALAYLVQSAPEIGIVRELISNVKAWIAKTFPSLIPHLRLNQSDYESLALMALRSEALVAGRLQAMFGKDARVKEVYEFKGPRAPRNFGPDTLLLEGKDLFDIQPEVRIRDHLDPSVPDEGFAQQVGMFADELLHGRVIERMFRDMPDFDVFQWRDAVDMAASGTPTPQGLAMLRRGVEMIEDNLGRDFEQPDYFEIMTPSAMQYWDKARADTMRKVALVMDMEQIVPRPGRPDKEGFITSAEKALNTLGGQFKDAKSLTAEQWRKALRNNGATGEAFEFQIEPALTSLGRGAGDRITREELMEAMARSRPKVETKAASGDTDMRTPEQQAPIAARIRDEAYANEGIATAMLNLLPKPLAARIVQWAENRMDSAFETMDGQRGGETLYSGYVSDGTHTNYRQELIIMPDAAKGYRSHNWNTEGVVGHIRTTDRVTARGEPVRYVDELQSDLHQEGAKKGYRERTVADRIADLEALRVQLRNEANAASVRTANVSPEEYAAAIRAMDVVNRSLADVSSQIDRLNKLPPRAPLEDWERPFIRRALQQAARDGIEVVAFTNYKSLNDFLKNDGTKKFYDDRMPKHISRVAKELGAKVERVQIDFSPYALEGVRVRKFDGGYDISWREQDGGYSEWFTTKAEADARLAVLKAGDKKEVTAIRLTPQAMNTLKGGVPMFAMRQAPGRMDDQLGRVVLDDIKEGRRGLSADESAALIGAADRWAAAVARQQPQRARGLQDIIEQARTRNDPQHMRELIEMMEIAKTTVPEPPSLLTWLRRQGGLKEMDGELGARNLQMVNLVNNRRGLDLDTATLYAQEAGYIKPGIDAYDDRGLINDLLDAIDREVGGEKVYSINDMDWVMEAAARADMRAELNSLGIDPSQSKKQILSEFERISKLQEGEPVTLRDVERWDMDERQANAKPGIGLPDRDLLGGKEIRINFNAIQTGDDIRSLMGQMADAFAEEIQGTRGPARPNVQVIKDARRQSAWKALNDRREGTPLTDSQVLAAQSLYVASAEHVKQALDLAMKTGTDMAHYNARRAITMHRAVQAEIAGAKADASRALRAWSIPRSSTAQARRELNSVMEAYGGKLDPEDAARLRQMIDSDPEAADKAVRSMGRKAADIGGAVLRFAWLSGPHTHMVNMAGNALTTYFDIGIRLSAGMRGKILGDPVLERQLSVAIAEHTGLMAGVRAQFAGFAKKADYARMGQRLKEASEAMQQGRFKDGLQQGASALAFDNPVSATFRGRFDDRGVNGANKFAPQGGDRAISAEAFGMKQGSVGAKLVDGVGAIVSAPTDFLGFQDDFFKGVNELAVRYRGAQEILLEELQNGLPQDQAKARFVELVNDPPQEVLDEARLMAQRRTFTEPTGEGTRTLLKARDYMNKLGFPLGHILLPFVTAPSNILKFGFQNGPTGLLFKEIQDELAAGGTRAAIAQSRIAAGTALLMVGGDLVAHGMMTGRAPSDPGERESWERQGKQEYSIKVGDKWVQYRRLEPVSTMLAIGADFQTIMLNSELNDGSDQDFAELVGPVLGSAINVITSKTYLTGAAEFIRFTEDPERYGSTFLESLGASIAAPAALAQIEKMEDPVIREASNVVERWMSRMPGFSKDLPPSLDLWGRPRSVSSGLGDGYDALVPFSVRTIDPEPIDSELSRIGFFPRRPDKKIAVQSPLGVNVSVNLRNRPDIWTRYVALAGNELKIFDGMGTRDYLNAVIERRHPDAAEYYMLPDSATEPVSKEWFINRRINQARTVARMELQREFRADLQAMANSALKAKRDVEQRREELAP